jgi:hypothetical protein
MEKATFRIIHSLLNSFDMLKTFPPSLLGQWVFNFTGNSDLPFVTASALIELAELEAFIIAIKKQQADSVRVYFLRFGPGDTPTDKSDVNGHLAEGCKWHMASSGLTQATVALVPAKNFQHDTDLICSADDIVTEEGMLTLYPGTVAVGTNLNPPGGNGSSLHRSK